MINFESARSTLLEHARSKKNGFFPVKASFEGRMTNPLCGDYVHLKGLLQNDKISEIGFSAAACAICTASASLLCQEVQGLTVSEALKVGYLLEENILASMEAVWPAQIQGLISFQHLRVNPARRACAILPHVVLRSTLKEHAV